MLQDSCISLLLRLQSWFGGGWLGGRLSVPLHGALAFLSWGGWRNKSTYTPQRHWWVGFSSGMLQLFPRMDSSLSMACLIASDKDQILELDSKAEFFFSFFFPPKSKTKVHGDQEEKQMIWVYQKLLFDHLEEFCVDVFTFTYCYSNLAVNMKSNFDFPPSILFKK